MHHKALSPKFIRSLAAARVIAEAQHLPLVWEVTIRGVAQLGVYRYAHKELAVEQAEHFALRGDAVTIAVKRKED